MGMPSPADVIRAPVEFGPERFEKGAFGFRRNYRLFEYEGRKQEIPGQINTGL